MPGAPAKPTFDCARCPGFCCNYELIEVTENDLPRLAGALGLSEDETFNRYLRVREGSVVLRHRKDSVYASTCVLFDQVARKCSLYAGRPQVCREYPDGPRCGYAEFLEFERTLQGDPAFVPRA